jgi:hypothetical protein
MGWLEDILEFLRQGPKGGKLDMNALFQGAVAAGQIEKDVAIQEINALVKWHSDRKKWHQDKTRQKMAADGASVELIPGSATFKGSDFGLDEVCSNRSFPHLLFSLLRRLSQGAPTSLFGPFRSLPLLHICGTLRYLTNEILSLG